jgi:hypothetical protein
MDDSTPNNPDSKTPQKNACASCARRKIKCDRQDPCSNCVKSSISCDFSLRVTPVSSRKRPADESVHARLHRYEELLRKNNIDFDSSEDWIHTTVKQQDDSSYTFQTTSNSTSSVLKHTNAQQ